MMRLLPILLVFAAGSCGEPGTSPGTQVNDPDSPSPADGIPPWDQDAALAETIRAAAPAFRDSGAPREPGHGPIRGWIQGGQTERALTALEPLSKSDASGEAAFLAGWTLFRAQRYALALPHLMRAVERGPAYPQAEFVFYLAGRCLQERGQLAAARAALEADINLRPKEGAGHFWLAQVLIETGDTGTCETHARAALQLYTRPQDLAKVHALLADIHLANDEPGPARQALERCVEIYPHYEAFYRLAQLCRGEGDVEAAERYLALHNEWRAKAGR